MNQKTLRNLSSTCQDWYSGQQPSLSLQHPKTMTKQVCMIFPRHLLTSRSFSAAQNPLVNYWTNTFSCLRFHRDGNRGDPTNYWPNIIAILPLTTNIFERLLLPKLQSYLIRFFHTYSLGLEINIRILYNYIGFL